MFMKFVVLALAVASASAHWRRDVPATTTEDTFKQVINRAEVAVKEAGEHISKMLGLDQNAPAGDQVVELIKNQTKAFTAQAEIVQRQLEDELKDLSNSTLANAFSDISKKIQETVSGFREQIEASGVGEKAAALQAKFQEGINTLVEEGKKLANNLEPQVSEAGKTLQDLTKKVIDEAVDNLNQLQSKLPFGNSNPVSQMAARLQTLTGDVIAQAVDALTRLKDDITGSNSYQSPPSN